MTNLQINGSHGEYTRSDDFRMTREQMRCLKMFGLTAEDLRPYSAGMMCFDSLTGGYLYFRELVTSSSWQVPQQGALTGVYGSSFLDWTLDDLPLSIGTVYSFSSIDLGVCWATNARALLGLSVRTTVDDEHAVFTHAADFRDAVYAQQGIVIIDAAQAAQTDTAFLNGTHGEWTNTDDVRRARASRRRNRQQVVVRQVVAGARRRARPRRRARARQGGGVALSNCAAKYARAIADPFSPNAIGACVPIYPSPPSYKVTSHSRAFTVTVGTSGVGGAWFMPTCYANTACALATTGSFSDTSIALPSTDPGSSVWARGYFGTLPFANGDNVEARIISMAARVTYTGTALDLSGMFVSFVEPDHHPIGIDPTIENLSTLPYAKVENTKRRMTNLTPIFGVKPSETQLLQDKYPLSGSDPGAVDYDSFKDNGYAGFVVSGVPGTTFNVEMITHVEYVGRQAAAGLTMSHSDSRGFEMIQQAGAQLATFMASTAQGAWPTMRRLLAEAGRDLAATAVRQVLPQTRRGDLRIEL